MRRVTWLLILMLATVWLTPAYAGVDEDFEEAYELRLAAAACLAAYSDRMGLLAREYLRQDGWEIRPITQSSETAEARFVLARSSEVEGRSRFILAIVGTETVKDVKVDLKTSKVYFAGRTTEEFAANAAMKDVPDTSPKVHSGFHDYVQAALTARTPDGKGGERTLGELLLADPALEIFLVGHSLGGAAATIGAARLMAMGVRPEQIKVITFGAPAVGNQAFCRQFEPVMDLTRVVISGDPVTGVLQKLVGGYHQFGRELVWKRSALFERGPHAMAEYLDLAMKRYYDVRTAADRAGVFALPRESPAGTEPRVYVAPPVNKLPDSLKAEFPYVEQAIADQYRRLLPGYVLGGAAPEGETAQLAAAAGSRWYVVTEVGGRKVKDEYNQFFVTVQHTVYETATGRATYVAEYASATANMTPLEALTHDAAGAVGGLAAWLAGR